MHGVSEGSDLSTLMMYSEGMTRQDSIQGMINISRRHAMKSACYSASKIVNLLYCPLGFIFDLILVFRRDTSLYEIDPHFLLSFLPLL